MAAWLSVYFYYQIPCEQFLAKEIYPFILDVMNKKYASQFFFIRYLDNKGPHVRLRLKTEGEIAETILKPYLISAFSNCPMRFSPYRPELERYGGNAGITIAEEQFEASSQTILTFLTEVDDWRYERRLGTALQLDIGMVHALGMEKEEVIAFFDHLVTKKLKSAFPVSSHTVQSQIKSLWHACEREQAFDKEWFAAWMSSMDSIKTKLKKAQHRLVLPHRPNHGNNNTWSLYESYVHMNNNRLGITSSDEQYIAYIIARSLEELRKNIQKS